MFGGPHSCFHYFSINIETETVVCLAKPSRRHGSASAKHQRLWLVATAYTWLDADPCGLWVICTEVFSLFLYHPDYILNQKYLGLCFPGLCKGNCSRSVSTRFLSYKAKCVFTPWLTRVFTSYVLFMSVQEHQKGVGLGRSAAEAQGPGGSAQLQGCVPHYGSGREAQPRGGKQGPEGAGCQGKLKLTLSFGNTSGPHLSAVTVHAHNSKFVPLCFQLCRSKGQRIRDQVTTPVLRFCP